MEIGAFPASSPSVTRGGLLPGRLPESTISASPGKTPCGSWMMRVRPRPAIGEIALALGIEEAAHALIASFGAANQDGMPIWHLIEDAISVRRARAQSSDEGGVFARSAGRRPAERRGQFPATRGRSIVVVVIRRPAQPAAPTPPRSAPHCSTPHGAPRAACYHCPQPDQRSGTMGDERRSSRADSQPDRCSGPDRCARGAGCPLSLRHPRRPYALAV